MRDYILNVLIALSQLGNTVLGGYPDESMSARAWRTQNVMRYLIDGFFLVVTLGNDKNHCQNAYESEKIRRQFPEDYRG